MKYLYLPVTILFFLSCTERDGLQESYPLVSVNIDLLDDVTRHAGKKISFFAITENADEIEWDFGDGTFSSDAKLMHTYVEKGTYLVQLTAWNKGHVNSTQLLIDVKDSIEMLLTNGTSKNWVFYNLDPILCNCKHSVEFNINGTVSWNFENGYLIESVCNSGENNCELNSRDEYYKVYRDNSIATGLYSAGNGLIIGNSRGSGAGYEIEVSDKYLSLKHGDITLFYQTE